MKRYNVTLSGVTNTTISNIATQRERGSNHYDNT